MAAGVPDEALYPVSPVRAQHVVRFPELEIVRTRAVRADRCDQRQVVEVRLVEQEHHDVAAVRSPERVDYHRRRGHGRGEKEQVVLAQAVPMGVPIRLLVHHVGDVGPRDVDGQLSHAEHHHAGGGVADIERVAGRSPVRVAQEPVQVLLEARHGASPLSHPPDSPPRGPGARAASENRTTPRAAYLGESPQRARDAPSRPPSSSPVPGTRGDDGSGARGAAGGQSNPRSQSVDTPRARERRTR